jgi:hypothetical protein
MAVGGTHLDYDASAADWARARDVLAGEHAVKAAGEKYLPRLDSQSEEEYSAYKARASFFGVTARTLEEYLDLVFRRAPVTSAHREALKASLKGICICARLLLSAARVSASSKPQSPMNKCGNKSKLSSRVPGHNHMKLYCNRRNSA